MRGAFVAVGIHSLRASRLLLGMSGRDVGRRLVGVLYIGGSDAARRLLNRTRDDCAARKIDPGTLDLGRILRASIGQRADRQHRNGN